MKIRDAEISDLMDVFAWRNDPLSCSMFINDKNVDIDEHEKWFQNSLINPERTLYIGTTVDTKVGICRFDYDQSTNCAEVSINLNPQMRGNSLSYKLLNNSISKYLENASYELKAAIKKENQASINIFEKCGFIRVKENDHFYFFIKNYKKL